MADVDKVIKCRDCGEEFVFTVGEQNFYKDRGFQHEPTRFRRARLQRGSSGVPRGRLLVVRPDDAGSVPSHAGKAGILQGLLSERQVHARHERLDEPAFAHDIPSSRSFSRRKEGPRS
jgi:hypothetical protein